MTRLYRAPKLAPAKIRIERAHVSQYDCTMKTLPAFSDHHRTGDLGAIITIGNNGTPFKVCPHHIDHLSRNLQDRPRTCDSCLRRRKVYTIHGWNAEHPKHVVCSDCWDMLRDAERQLSREKLDSVDVEKLHPEDAP